MFRVPRLISVNTESTSASSSFWWIVRQLITIRLYHPKWPLVKLHGLATAVGSVLAVLGLAVLVVSGSRLEFICLLSLLVAFQLWNYLLLCFIERANLRIIREREFGLDLTREPANWPLQIFAYLLVQLIQPVACVIAGSARTVRWRGIRYRIDQRQVEMSEYLPYRETAGLRRPPGMDSIS